MLRWVCRHFIVSIEGEPEPIGMETWIRSGESHPLVELVDRLIEDLAIRSREAIRQGKSIRGEGWVLDQHRLDLEIGTESLTVPLCDVAKTGVFDGKFCIWRNGDEQAVAKFSLEGRNLPLLDALLGESLQDREQQTTPAKPSTAIPGSIAPDTGTELGRILFERKPDTERGAMCLIGAAAILVGFIIYDVDKIPILGEILLVGGILLLVMAFWMKESIFRCHEIGVFQKGPMGKRFVRYDQIDIFVYKATSLYFNGAYNGTTLKMKFIAPATTINYERQIKNADDDLDHLRDHISSIVAERLAEQLEQNGQVVWTPNITLRQDTIEYAPQGFLGLKGRVVLPYDQIRTFDIQKGTFFLWNHEKKSVMKESVGAPNFFPGFLLLTSIIQQQED